MEKSVPAISDHWCAPPAAISPQALNITLAEWKARFLPTEVGPDQRPRPSQCYMYKVPGSPASTVDLGDYRPTNDTERVPCTEVLGYEYDTSDMLSTAVTDNDWVCDRCVMYCETSWGVSRYDVCRFLDFF